MTSAYRTAKAIVLGEPASPNHQINPVELVRYLESLEIGLTLPNNLFFEDALSDLNAVTTAVINDIGFVLSDGANNGTYRYTGSAWVQTAALPPGFDDSSIAESTGFAILRAYPYPGETPQNFTPDLTGPVGGTTDLVGQVIGLASEGSFVRLTGSKIIATRERFRIDPAERYELKWVVRRHLNPTDPAGDTVRIAIKWLDGLKNTLSDTIVEDITLTEAMGNQNIVRFVFNGASGGFGIDIPPNAIYMVPYVQTFGADGQTDIVQMYIDDYSQVARTFYVTMDGNDDALGSSVRTPLATIGAALLKAQQENNPCIVIVHPGEYEVQPDTVIPRNCALYGYDLRVTKLSLPVGSEQENMFQMSSGIKVRGFTFTNLRHEAYTFDTVTNTYNPPEKGWAFVFKPGEVITRSPYIADCSQLHNFTQDQLVLPIDKPNGNPDMPRGGGNILADGSVLDPDSPLRSVVVDSFTAINPNGVGYCIKRNAFVQLVSVFTNWSRVGLWSHQGGQVTVANSNNTFGDYAIVSTGFRNTVVIPDTDPALLSEQDTAAGTIDSQFESIISDLMIRYALLPGWNSAYDELAERDSRTILKAIANDLRSGQDRATQYVTKGFFDWNAQFAFDATLVGIFIASWNEIENELYQRISDTAARAMVTLLLDILRDTVTDIGLNGSASNYVVSYTSVVEATGQQFSYAGSGVKYNSLPASQRGTGSAPPPSSAILKENGGRVYATFSTETGDTYLGEDLRIDFERSTIEGQAFSRGVQNIALPLIIGIGG
jgi:hypothetical protein